MVQLRQTCSNLMVDFNKSSIHEGKMWGAVCQWMISTYLGPRIVATLSGLCRYFLPSLPLSPLSSRKCLSCGLTHCVSWWLSWDQLPSYPAPTWCNYQEICCSATTRLNFLYSQLDFFPQARTLHAQSEHPHSLDNLWIKVVIIFDKRKKVDIDMM